jgi:hypothetical protein
MSRYTDRLRDERRAGYVEALGDIVAKWYEEGPEGALEWCVNNGDRAIATAARALFDSSYVQGGE